MIADRHTVCITAGWLAAAALLTGPVIPAYAGAQDIDEVVVSATRMPVAREELAGSSEEILIEDELRAFQGLNFTEALVAVPGLFVQSHYNAAQDLRLDLRGFGARGNFGIRGIRIYVDGMPESLPDGQVQVDSLDPQGVRRIEILRGPAASLYGNAAGGVILIETLPVNTAPPWRLSYSLGAHGFSSYGASVRTANPQAGPVARLSASQQTFAGYREHAASENLRAAVEVSIPLGDRDMLEVRARATDAPLAHDPGGLNFTDFRQNPRRAAANNVLFNAGEILDQQSLVWRWQRTLRDQASLQLSNYFTWRDFENRLPFRDGGAVVLGRRLGGASAQYRWQQNPRLRWSAGLDLDQQRDHRRRFDNESGRRTNLRLDQVEEVTSFGAFVASHMRMSERLALQAALRFDALHFSLEDRFMADGDDSGRRHFDRLSPALGLLLDASGTLSLYARYSTSFEAPTTTEFANPEGAGFNPTLSPQSSRAWELGLRRGADRSSRMPELELAAYEVNVRDELLAFELASQPGRSFFVNASSSRRRGLELSASTRRTKAVAFRISAAWSDAVFQRFEQNGQDYSGRQIPGSPRLRLAGSLTWRPAENWSLGVDGARVWRVYADNANAVRSPDFLDAGLRVAYGRNVGSRRMECFAGVRNLLDQSFADNLRINAFGGRYFEPSPPRHLYAGLRVSGRD